MAGNKGRGWHGDSAAHARVGQRGGLAPHPHGRGLQNADERTRAEVARKGGRASRGRRKMNQTTLM